MMIRLIDVVLIILVGFVSVADIVPKSQIKLPQKEKEKEQQQEQEDIPIVYLGVLAEGYYIKIVDEDSSYYADENFAALEMNLVNYYYNHPQSQIIILPHDFSPIQNTINVIDLCQEYNIPKNLVFSDVTENQ